MSLEQKIDCDGRRRFGLWAGEQEQVGRGVSGARAPQSQSPLFRAPIALMADLAEVQGVATDGAVAEASAAVALSAGEASALPVAQQIKSVPLGQSMGGDEDDDDDDEDGEGGPARKKRGGHGRRKIEIEYIEDKIRRHITFSKRKAGISKKAYELSRLTGAQVRETPGAGHFPPYPAAALALAPLWRPVRPRSRPRHQIPHVGNLITLSPFADALALSLCVCPSAGPPSDLIRARADLLLRDAQAAADPRQ